MGDGLGGRSRAAGYKAPPSFPPEKDRREVCDRVERSGCYGGALSLGERIESLPVFA